jgi:hypothetical protein
VAPAESRGIGDLHSHLVPAVDDGACSLEEALDAVERMVERGVRSIVTTPHLNASTTKVASDREARLAEVDEAWNEVCGAVKVRFPTLGFRRGHEVMLDIPDPDLSDPRVRLSGTSFVLVEWPRLQIPPQTEPVLERICAEGYRPIIAHPERYRGMAQTIDSSVLTAGANDFSFDDVFARQVEALGRKGDLLILHSTSGESENLIRAAAAARAADIETIALLAKGGGRLLDQVDHALVVPTESTAHAQEIHLAIGHSICDRVDRFFAEENR